VTAAITLPLVLAPNPKTLKLNSPKVWQRCFFNSRLIKIIIAGNPLKHTRNRHRHVFKFLRTQDQREANVIHDEKFRVTEICDFPRTFLFVIEHVKGRKYKHISCIPIPQRSPREFKASYARSHARIPSKSAQRNTFAINAWLSAHSFWRRLSHICQVQQSNLRYTALK